ncbi:jerky protein homolog-like [Sabethes cyaneus]|uniref:jerky protein homolog-like n=1 Tax=Sabethes cyaneus TaxID=53552 RepID=UPI00237ECB27|nr:jerky protein homolog-like [Sabethes cyaneus]
MLTVAGERASSDTEAFTAFKNRFMQTILVNQYEKWEIDESALFVKVLPSRSLALHDEDITEGRKVIKNHITFMPCCNIDGSNKLPLFFLGVAANPRDLPKDKTLLPVYYKHSKKAWMNRALFKEWFISEFVPSVRTFAVKNNHEPRALLVLDNFSAHFDGGSPLESDDGKIKVLFLPSNVTSLGQPMDQGVLNAIKKRYKKKLLVHLLLDYKDLVFEERLKRISLRQIIDWLHQSWEGISSKTIEDTEEDTMLDEDMRVLVSTVTNTLQDEPPNANDIEDWLNDSIRDASGNCLVKGCDIYDDNEIINYIMNGSTISDLNESNCSGGNDNELIDDSMDNQSWITVEHCTEGAEKHEKAMECIDFLIDYLEEEEEMLDVTKLSNIRSKFIEMEFRRRRIDL